jgi:hypothetical protein
MTLKPIDKHHFYLDDKLIDLVWIGHKARRQTNAANYHEMNRSLNWLNKLASRLMLGEIRDGDEQGVQRRLAILGLEWYLDENDG